MYRLLLNALYTSTQNGRVEKYEEVKNKVLSGREREAKLREEFLNMDDNDDGKSFAELSLQLDSTDFWP